MSSEAIKQQVRRLFLQGGKYTAKQLNKIVGFNDSRKVISELRAKGWNIQDLKQPDGCKLYWLATDQKQLEAKQGGAGR